jgi:hypothetical protein
MITAGKVPEAVKPRVNLEPYVKQGIRILVEEGKLVGGAGIDDLRRLVIS